MRRTGKGHALSIGAKTLLSHVTLAITIIVLTALLSYALSNQYIRQVMQSNLQDSAQRIAGNIHLDAEGRILPNQRNARLYEEIINAKIFYLDSRGEAIRFGHFHSSDAADEDVQWTEVLDSIDREYAARVLSGEMVSALQHFEFAQAVVLFAGVPVRDERGEVVGGVILAQPVAMLRSLSRRVRTMLNVVVILALLLAMLLATQQTRRLVGPIQRLTRAAKRMEDGVYAERIGNLPGDEIGALGHALNSMSGRLVEVIRSLREERDKLELVVSGIGEGLIAVDLEGDVVRHNQVFLAMTEQDSVERFMADEGRCRPLRDLLERCVQTGEAEKLTWRSASDRALSATASPLKDESGNLLGAVCLLRDISAAERMEQLSRDYVANISHELRTPLTGIRGMVEPLIDGCMDTEAERQDSYRVILKETIRLEKLVGEMLDLSRLQEGRVTLEPEPMALRGILEAALRSMQPIADEAGIALRLETDSSELICLGSEDRVTQVLVILMDNALSFTPRGGSVTLSAREAGGMIAVTVKDTGCGIEPKDLPLIWERFYKADKSRMRTTGTGLGLSIARLVVGLMGGEISARSEPGKGAEFTFTLPKGEA